MSIATLRDLWLERDRRYAMWRHDLPDRGIDAVRTWRGMEASRLRPEVREDAEAEAAAWNPPPRVR